MYEGLKKFCDGFLEKGVPGFDLAVFKGGECILRYMNGFSDLENKVKINGKERYNIYSCSKVITCTAALMLWEKGMYSLEDKLSDYMPEFSEMTVKTEKGIEKAKNPILIKHLFEMTAGFSYNCGSDELIKCKKETNGKCPTRETMKYLAKDPLCFEPGKYWQYSLCHDVLAAFVEVVSGVKFEDFVKNNIFIPLSMDNTTFMLPDNELYTVSEQYRCDSVDGKNVIKNIGKNISWYKLGSEYASGGAGCVSTTEDYIKFLEGLRTHKLLKPETLKLMITERLNDEQNSTYWTKGTHGYGLGVRCPKSEDAIYTDFGWGGAAGAYLAVNLENEISLYFACHLMNSPVQGIRSMLYRIFMAEHTGNEEDMKAVKSELEKLYDYNLTY